LLFVPGGIRAAGTTADAFLQVPVGARAEGMGGAFSALAQGASAMEWNPAGLGFLAQSECDVEHLEYVADISEESVAAACPWRGQGFGAAADWLNVPSFNSTLDSGAASGSAQDLKVGVGYGVPVAPCLSVGFDLWGVNSRLSGESAAGIVGDGGLMANFFRRRMRLALELRNLGVQGAWGGSADPLPTQWRAGASWIWREATGREWGVADFDAVGTRNQRADYAVGAECKPWAGPLALRAGLRFAEGGVDLEEADAESGMIASFGLGLDAGATELDYAYEPFGELGNVQRFGLRWRFRNSTDARPGKDLLKGGPRLVPSPDGTGSEVLLEFSDDPDGETDWTHWRVDFYEGGSFQKSYGGEGPPPPKLTWPIGPVQAGTATYSYRVLLRDGSGRDVESAGEVQAEIATKAAFVVAPAFDSGAGGLVFRPKPPLNVAVKEWKLEIRDPQGNLLKTLAGAGAIPKTLVWRPGESGPGLKDFFRQEKRVMLAFKLSYTDARQRTSVVRDEVQLPETFKPLPLPHEPQEFKVAKGRGILVVVLPLLRSASAERQRKAVFSLEAAQQGTPTSWVLTVRDAAGAVMRSWGGEGDAPDSLVWDGKDMQGSVCEDPTAVNWKFALHTPSGDVVAREARAIGAPFRSGEKSLSVRRRECVFFRRWEGSLPPEAVSRLRKTIKEESQGAGAPEVLIVGHSWDEGAEAAALSQERADSVLRFLLDKTALKPKGLQSVGVGDGAPAVMGAHVGAALNRGVDLIFVEGE